MDSRRDFTSKKVFSGYFSELGEKANSALLTGLFGLWVLFVMRHMSINVIYALFVVLLS